MKKIINYILILSSLSINANGQAHLPTLLITSCVFIEHIKGTGTGFLIKDSSFVYFVTARHNIYDLNTNKVLVDKIKLTAYHDKSTVDDKNIINIDIKTAISKKLLYSKNIDDALVIKIGELEIIEKSKYLIDYYQIVQKSKSSWINPLPIEVIKGYDDIYIGDDIYLFGYPTSIGLKQSPQFDFTRPLIRRGVVAGKYDKLKTLILDCPSYPGNSGGPVIRKVTDGFKWEYNLIGLVVQFIPYEEQWINIKSGLVSTDRFNSGYSVAISGDKILELIKNFNIELK